VRICASYLLVTLHLLLLWAWWREHLWFVCRCVPIWCVDSCWFVVVKLWQRLVANVWNVNYFLWRFWIILCDVFKSFCDEMNVLPVDEPRQAHVIK
jgi:hypothetical protein